MHSAKRIETNELKTRRLCDTITLLIGLHWQNDARPIGDDAIIQVGFNSDDNNDGYLRPFTTAMGPTLRRRDEVPMGIRCDIYPY